MGKESIDSKVAIVHDYLRTYGGGERVLEAFNKIWPEAKIFLATADFKRLGLFGDKFRRLNIRTSWAQKLPFLVKKPILYRFLLPFVWSTMDVGDVDIVISSSGSNISKGIKIPKGAIHICYCHTPPRFLYGLETETPIENNFISFLIKPALFWLKKYDLMTNKNVDIFIANSKTVKGRINKFYKRDAVVIYPPCKVPKNLSANLNGKYFLVVSRLERSKRIDLIIKAFNYLNYPLKIVGSGSYRDKLKKFANINIEFSGEVSDIKIKRLYQECRALVVAAKDEDFGISAVEAMGFGKPVIACFSGGYKETVVEGKTGIFFQKFSEKSLVGAVRRFERMKFNPKIIWLHSQRFSEDRFNKEIRKLFAKILEDKFKL